MNQGGTADSIFVLDRISVRDFLFIGGKLCYLQNDGEACDFCFLKLFGINSKLMYKGDLI